MAADHDRGDRETVTVRRSVAADGHDMARLAHAAYAVYVPRIGRPPAPMTADYASVASGEDAWVAEENGRVIAFIVLEPHPDHLLLENVAVAQDRQGAGVGSLLLSFAEEHAHSLDLPEVRLFTNAAMTENVDYYRRHGYQETHRAKQDGYYRVFFQKDIRDAGPNA